MYHACNQKALVMLGKEVRNFLISVISAIPMLFAHSVSASVSPDMPEYMKITNSPDEASCWEAYAGFMESGADAFLSMIFTVPGRGSVSVRSELCYQKLFGLKEGYPEFDVKIKATRKEFRELLLPLAATGNKLARRYAIEAVENKYLGFQPSELSADDYHLIAEFMPKSDSAKSGEELVVEGESGDASIKDRIIMALVSKNAGTQIKEVALRWAKTSDKTRSVLLSGVFESRYGLNEYQPRALELLEEFALQGNSKAFEIMRTKIGIAPVAEIAKKAAVIAAADEHNIDSAVGGWRSFLISKGVLSQR